MMIKPYNRQSWERVYSAFSEYLDKMRTYSNSKRDHAQNELKQRAIACEKYSKEYRTLNGHLLGIGDYTHTGIRLSSGAASRDRVINLTHHANGTPIAWRVEPLPLSADEQLFKAQLKLAA